MSVRPKKNNSNIHDMCKSSQNILLKKYLAISYKNDETAGLRFTSADGKYCAKNEFYINDVTNNDVTIIMNKQMMSQMRDDITIT